MLLFDIELLFLQYQMNKIDNEHHLDETRDMINKKQKEFSKEKGFYTNEVNKIKKRKQKVDVALVNFLANSAKMYKPEYSDSEAIEVAKKLIDIYKSEVEDNQTNSINLFDEEKDALYELTIEQKDFLNFARSQDRVKSHYQNRLELIKKADEFNYKLNEYKKIVSQFVEATFEPYKQAYNNYNQLKDKFDNITSQKEKVFKEFLEKMDDNNLQKQIEQLTNQSIMRLMKMLPTTHNSIIFPETLPEEALDFFNQMLLFDIELLWLNKQLEQRSQLDEQKVFIDKTIKEFVKEKHQLKAELAKLNKKQEKITFAIARFLANTAKNYKVKNRNLDIEDFMKKLMFIYKDDNGNMNEIDLLDKEKDEFYKATPEQKDFLNFLRSQDDAKIHYTNIIENNRKGDECNAKFDEFNKKTTDFQETVVNPHNQLIENYNQLEKKKDLIAVQKEKVFKEFLEKMDDPGLKEHIEQLVESLNKTEEA
jgi:hypothetical protein